MMRSLRNRLAASTALALVLVAPTMALAANYSVDNNLPQTQADLPANPNNNGFVIVGNANPNQVLTINSSYSNSVLVLGNTPGSSGNQVTITGAGTIYSNTIGNPVVTGPALVVGVNSTGNKLVIQNSAAVAISVVDGNSAYDVQVGYNKGADNNTLNVKGGASLTANGSTIYVGYAGADNTLTVEDGSTASALQMRIGGGSGSLGAGNVNLGATPSGNLVTITGAGSGLTTLGSVNLGATGGVIGGSNTLEVLDGATATLGLVNHKTLTIGQANGSNGNQVFVSGTNSVLNAWNVVVGNGTNTGNVLKIGDAGQVNSSTVITFAGNSTFIYGAGGTQQALATAHTGITIGGNVLVRPYISSPVGLQRDNVMLTLASGTTADQFAGLDLSQLTPVTKAFTANLLQYSTHFDLELVAQLGDGQVLNLNQSAVADGLNDAFNSGAVLPTGFAPLFLSMTGATLRRELTLISGEASTGAQQNALQMGGGFLNLISGPNPAGMQSAAARSPDHRLTLWLGGYGSLASLSGSSTDGSNRLTTRGGGAAIGAEYQLAPSTSVGVAIGGAASSWSVGSGLGGGHSDAMQVGVYAHQDIGAGYLAGAVGFGNHWTNTARTVDGDRLEGDYTAQVWSGRLEAGYRVAMQNLGVTPYGAVQV